MTMKELEDKVENLSNRVKKLTKQIDKQHDTVINLFDYIKSRTRGRRKREMIDIIQSQLW